MFLTAYQTAELQCPVRSKLRLTDKREQYHVALSAIMSMHSNCSVCQCMSDCKVVVLWPGSSKVWFTEQFQPQFVFLQFCGVQAVFTAYLVSNTAVNCHNCTKLWLTDKYEQHHVVLHVGILHSCNGCHGTATAKMQFVTGAKACSSIFHHAHVDITSSILWCT